MVGPEETQLGDHLIESKSPHSWGVGGQEDTTMSSFLQLQLPRQKLHSRAQLTELTAPGGFQDLGRNPSECHTNETGG